MIWKIAATQIYLIVVVQINRTATDDWLRLAETEIRVGYIQGGILSNVNISSISRSIVCYKAAIDDRYGIVDNRINNRSIA